MMEKIVVAVFVLFGAAALSACGTIINGTAQDIGFTSTPSGAKVMLNNQNLGVTPVITRLSRKDNHVVKFELDGYEPIEVTLTRSTSGWVWGNLVFGGLVGLAVDAMTGGLYKLTPQQVTATLNKQTVMTEKDGLYVAVVMRPSPEWEKIGEFGRASE